MTLGAWLRRGALVLALVVLGLALLTARVLIDGERALALSDAAFDQGDVRTATLHARRAAVAWAPGAPHVEPAYARLVAIATGAEVAGDRELAAAAWRAVRGAALETRHVFVPRQADLDRANQNLARLALPADLPPEQARAASAQALAELDRDDAPRAPWVVLLAVGFLLACGGLGVVGWRGITPDGELVASGLRLGGSLLFAGALCWAVAVLRA